MNKATQDAVQNAETMMKDAQGAFQTAFEKMTKSFEDMSKFGTANVEAAVKSNEISAKAAEAYGNKIVELSKANFDESVKAAQELSSVKTVNELFEKQTAFAKASFEKFTEQATALNDMATKSAKEAFAPINARVEAAGELAKSVQA